MLELPSALSGGSGAGSACARYLASLILFVSVPSVVLGALVPINNTMSGAAIRELIANSDLSETATLRLGSGEYEYDQISAILSTRSQNLSVEVDGPVTLNCSANITDGGNATVDFPGAIEVANASNYRVSGVGLNGEPALSVVSCPLLFSNPSQELMLDSLRVTGGFYANPGIIAAVAIASTNHSSAPAANITVRRCLFEHNAATPLLIESHQSCVHVENCTFLDNKNHVGEAAIIAFSQTTLPLVLSAGIALVAHGNQSVVSQTCSSGPRVRLWNSQFLYDHVMLNMSFTQPVLPHAQVLSILDQLNGGLNSCGAGLYLYLTGTGLETGHVEIGGNTNFAYDRTVDVMTPVAAGGGICAHFWRDSSFWNLTISDVTFEHNHAERTGALHILFDQGARNSTAQCLGMRFANNVANPNDSYAFHESRGGAVSIEMGRDSQGNTVFFQDSLFQENKAGEGGAMHIYYHSAEQFNRVHMVNCNFTDNTGVSGSAVYILSSHRQGVTSVINSEHDVVLELYVYCTVLTDCRFQGNSAYTSGALSASFSHVVMRGLNQFVGNLNSAINLVNSFLYIADNAVVNLRRNVGGIGGAVFSSDSETILYKNTTVSFVGNIAQTTGGAIQANMHTR